MLRLFLLLSVAAVFAKIDYSGHKVVRIYINNDNERQAADGLVKGLDIWKELSPVINFMDVRIPPTKFKQITTALRSTRINFEITVDDVGKQIEAEQTPSANINGLADFADYKNYDEIEAYLYNQATICGARCSLDVIGLSHEGRNMYVMKITDATASATKAQSLWIDSGIHAREWIATSTGLYHIDRFINDFGVDSEVDDILSNYDLHILPNVNPDGYAYTWTDDRLWRKTRQQHPDNVCYGVDANRNYDFEWNTIGASDNPCSDTFCGPNPHSEPETAAQRDWVFNLARTTLIKSFWTLHTYGQLWMAPYGYTTDLPHNYEELMRVGNIGAAALTAVHGTTYQVGAASEILYESSGTSRDWAAGHENTNISYVYTLELRNENSFVLPADQILPTGQETFAGFKAMVNAIPYP